MSLDPLTAAVLTLKEIREMTTEMLEELRTRLPQFEGKSIKPTPTTSIPPDCQPVDVPLDPALAIGKRLGALIEQKTDEMPVEMVS